MSGYKEKINQFVVECHELMDDRARAECLINGIDPDNLWSLKYSFTTLAGAELQLQMCEEAHHEFCTIFGYNPWKQFRIRDLGTPVEIERSM